MSAEDRDMLALRAGAYHIERTASAYLIIDTGAGDERCVARLEFTDDDDRKAKLKAALRTALDLSETRLVVAKGAV